MITLDMLKKSAPVRISIGHFSTESNIVLLPIKLMSGEVDYDLEGKTVTASFEGKPMTAPLEVIEGVIQLQVTNDLLSIGENRIQLAINWPGNKQELSPIMLWRILSPIVPGTDPGSIDILSSLINQTNEAIAKEAEREQAEINRNVYEAFDALKAYKVNNKVSYQGSSYVCTTETVAGTLPIDETYWMLSASKGDVGPQGVQGVQGIQGIKGDQGNQGIQGLKGDKGDQGEQGPAGGNIILDDAVAATDKVWSSQKVSAQLADIEQKVDVDIPAQLNDKVQNFKLKNEIVNGDFSQGNIGFIATGTGSTISVIDGKLNVLAGGQYRGTQRPTTTILNNKYYLRAQIDGPTNIYFGFRFGSPQKYKKINGVEYVSLVRQSTAASNNIEVLDNRVSGNTVYTVDELVVVDLTTIFGVGNEPTEIEMDDLMKVIPNGWWEGELTLTQKEFITWQLNLIRKTPTQ